MRREKWRIAALLGRCGPRYTASIVCGPRSVAPCTSPFLTTRWFTQSSSTNPANSISAHLGLAPKLGTGITAEDEVVLKTKRFIFLNRSSTLGKIVCVFACLFVPYTFIFLAKRMINQATWPIRQTPSRHIWF